MSTTFRFITRRITHVLMTSALIVALGGAVTSCAKNAARSTNSENATTKPSMSTDSSTTPAASPVSAAPTDAEAPTVSNPGPVTQTTLPKPGEFQVLVTILETGGMCAGPCGEIETIIYSDGTWTYGLAPNLDPGVTATTLPPTKGQLDTALVAQLKTALSTATAAQLQALPLTQQYCPSAADGRDLSFTYRLQGTEATVSNCTVDLVAANELLRITSLAREDISVMANQKG